MGINGFVNSCTKRRGVQSCLELRDVIYGWHQDYLLYPVVITVLINHLLYFLISVLFAGEFWKNKMSYWVQFHQHVFEQLLQVQIPKSIKRQSSCQCFLHFWDLGV